MKNRNKAIATMSTILFGTAFFILHIRNNDDSNVFNSTNPETPEKYHLIAHAGGEFLNHRYTNSLEAVEHNLNNGFYAIELDIRETSDGIIYAAHDPKEFRLALGINEKADDEDKDPRSNQLNGKLLYGKFTPLDSEKIRKIFNEHPNSVLITDKIRNYKLVRKNFDFNDRIYVEVFNIKDYIRASIHGIKHPILNATSSKQAKFLIKLLNINLISTSTSEIINNELFYSDLKASGVSVLVYTVNDEKFLSRYKNSISAAYTDNINPKTKKCETSKCDIY